MNDITREEYDQLVKDISELRDQIKKQSDLIEVMTNLYNGIDDKVINLYLGLKKEYGRPNNNGMMRLKDYVETADHCVTKKEAAEKLGYSICTIDKYIYELGWEMRGGKINIPSDVNDD